ncbi:MAG TPA: DHH family phosphoesterase, partial [Candidatus Bathyarchaeia archaeon]|nr:DHH family phosphoesterase [Candidatus Bathyarchaeia archaeon]
MLPRSSSGDERHLELDKRAGEAASVIRKFAAEKSPILLVTHFDADGISAGSVILAAVKRLGAPAHLRAIDNLSEKVLEELEDVEADLAIFTDIGSGYLSIIGKALRHKEIVIADHHQTLGEQPPNSHHFNTHLLGFDGSVEISGAGTAYLLAK